jgi:hypothetical protein
MVGLKTEKKYEERDTKNKQMEKNEWRPKKDWRDTEQRNRVSGLIKNKAHVRKKRTKEWENCLE